MVDDIRAPAAWRRPKTKIYDYNQDLGSAYYKPMIDYVNRKELQGIFFEKPTERVHLPDPAELVMMSHEGGHDVASGTAGLDRALVQFYSQQSKESNSATAHTIALMLRGDKSNTTLGPKLTASKLRDYYAREINVSKVRAGGPGWA